MMNQRHGHFTDLTPRTRCCDHGVLYRGDLAEALHREVLPRSPMISHELPRVPMSSHELP